MKMTFSVPVDVTNAEMWEISLALSTSEGGLKHCWAERDPLIQEVVVMSELEEHINSNENDHGEFITYFQCIPLMITDDLRTTYYYQYMLRKTGKNGNTNHEQRMSKFDAN